MNSFKEFDINEKIADGLLKASIEIPTDVQVLSIPHALLGKDIIVESITGSGKTLAYLIPIFNKIDVTKKEPQVIIFAPTHELTMQVASEIKKLASNSDMGITHTTIIGEVNVNRQIDNLKSKPHIIVGTIGRITELVKMKKIKLHTVKTIVFDEVDRLFSDNKEKLYKEIVKATLKERQLMAFSASVDDEIVNKLDAIFKPERELIKISNSEVNPNIEHYFIKSELRDKWDTLRRLCSVFNEERFLVFMNKNEHIQDVENRLKHHKVSVCSIYGASSKEERKDAISGFRSKKYKVMIASDIAARGLDIENLNIIVNMDIPKDSKEYLHRVGRTGGNGKRGVAFSIVTEMEKSFIKSVAREYDIEFYEKFLENGKITD